MARSRRARSSGSGSVVTFAVLAICAGVAFGFRDEIARLARDSSRDQTPPAPPASSEHLLTPDSLDPPAAESRPVRQIAVEPARTIVPPAERETARTSNANGSFRSRYSEAEAAMKALDFERAAALYRTAASQATGRTRQNVEAMAERAELFGAMTKGVKPNPEATADVVILRRDSGDMEVVLLGETASAYQIARRSGIRGEIPKSEVRAVERIGREAYTSGRSAEITRRAQALEDPSAADYWLLGVEAYKDLIGDLAVGHMTKAHELAGKDLPLVVRQHEARQMLFRALWNDSTGRSSSAEMWCRRLIREYPEQAELVAEAEELRTRMAEREKIASAGSYQSTVTISLSDEEVTGIEIVEVKSGSSGNVMLVSRINSTFREAMASYVAGQPGKPDSNRNLRNAVAKFDEVVEMCKQALRSDPKNQDLINRQLDASRFAYHARKMQTLAVK